MPLLTENTAKQIIERLAKVVPYQLSVISADGAVMSSNRFETGTKREAAVRAVRLQEAVITYQNRETQQQGISFPLRLNDKIVGVLEINGDLDAILPIGQMVVTLTQLMMENNAYHDMISARESRMNDFFYDWLHYHKEDWNERFLGMAHFFSVDLTKERVGVIVRIRRIRYSVMEQVTRLLRDGEYVVRKSLDSFTLLLLNSSGMREHLQQIMNITADFEQCFVGVTHNDVRMSVKEAEQAAAMADLLGLTERVVDYASVAAENMLVTAQSNGVLDQLMQLLKESDAGGVLTETIVCLARSGDNRTAVCDALHIHRNTLNYRLDKLRELTQLNPSCPKDMTLLYAAALRMRMI